MYLSYEKSIVGDLYLPRRRPTLRDVAEMANTSVKTASRVVNNEDGVSSELASRVQTAVQILGYRPDDRARRLRRSTATNGVIGLIQADVSNPFFASIFFGVEEVASEMGHVVLAAGSEGSADRFDEIVESFITRRVDGLIVVPVGNELSLIRREMTMGTPVVFVDQVPSEPIGDVVTSDHFGGALSAVTHLMDAGHTRIAFLGDDPAYFSASERKRGWLAAHDQHGLTADPSIVRDRVGASRPAERAVLQLMSMEEPPTALFTAQNLISIGAIRALKSLGLDQQVAMVGFDDIELADVLDPGLTCAPQDPVSLGRTATRLLFRRISGESGPAETVVIPVELVIRGSGEIRPS